LPNKNAEDPAALVFRKEIGYECGRDGDEGCLANSDEGCGEQQFPIVMVNAVNSVRALQKIAPRTIISLREITVGPAVRRTEQRPYRSQKCAGEIANLRIGEVKFALD